MNFARKYFFLFIFKLLFNIIILILNKYNNKLSKKYIYKVIKIFKKEKEIR